MRTFEWVIETLDRPDCDEAEILDVDHTDSYIEAVSRADAVKHARIGLVLDTDDDRAWAYVEAGALPDHLEDAFGRAIAAVPQKYRRQFLSVTG